MRLLIPGLVLSLLAVLGVVSVQQYQMQNDSELAAAAESWDGPIGTTHFYDTSSATPVAMGSSTVSANHGFVTIKNAHPAFSAHEYNAEARLVFAATIPFYYYDTDMYLLWSTDAAEANTLKGVLTFKEKLGTGTTTSQHYLDKYFRFSNLHTSNPLKLTMQVKPLSSNATSSIRMRVYLYDARNQSKGYFAIRCIPGTGSPTPWRGSDATGVTGTTTRGSDGWTNCTLSGTLDASTTAQKVRLELQLERTDGTVSYLGDGKSGVQVKNLLITDAITGKVVPIPIYDRPSYVTFGYYHGKFDKPQILAVYNALRPSDVAYKVTVKVQVPHPSEASLMISKKTASSTPVTFPFFPQNSRWDPSGAHVSFDSGGVMSFVQNKETGSYQRQANYYVTLPSGVTTSDTLKLTLSAKPLTGTTRLRAYLYNTDNQNNYLAMRCLAPGTTANAWKGSASSNLLATTTLANGWTQCSLQGRIDSLAGKHLRLEFMMEKTDGSTSYAGDGTTGVYIKDVKLTKASTPTPAVSCTLDGITVAPGSSRYFYKSSTVPAGQVCGGNNISKRTCTNSVLSGSPVYAHAACTPSSSSSPSTPAVPVTLPITLQNSVWSPSGTHATFNGSVMSFIQNQESGSFQRYIDYLLTLPSGITTSDTLSVSLLAKPHSGVTRLRVYLYNTDNQNNYLAMRCLAPGTTANAWRGSISSNLSFTSTAASDGWTLCTLQGKIDSLAGNHIRFELMMEKTDGSTSYAGDGTTGVDIKNVMFTKISTP